MSICYLTAILGVVQAFCKIYSCRIVRLVTVSWNHRYRLSSCGEPVQRNSALCGLSGFSFPFFECSLLAEANITLLTKPPDRWIGEV